MKSSRSCVRLVPGWVRCANPQLFLRAGLAIVPPVFLSSRMTLRFVFLLLLLLPPPAAGEKTWIVFNNGFKGTIALDLRNNHPCLTRPLLEEWGVRAFVLDRLKWDADRCMTQDSAREYDLQFWYRPDAHLLTLLFPEDAVNPQQNGVTTSRWEDGINAMFFNYRLEMNKQNALASGDIAGTDAALTLESGLNLGAWRLRQRNTFWRQRDGLRGSYPGGTSLWRSITALRSRLNVGDEYTSPNLFDSMAYRGVSLASAEAMFPDSWRPYTPVINGYARSEAEVTIHQNGERVYRIHVPPGPFTIRDFNPPDAQGNLELVVQESDGTERARWLPYSLMPNLVQTGMFSYELTAGRYKPARGMMLARERFWQGTLSWGAASPVTLFGGLQQAENYVSQVLGAGGNMGLWGAASLDLRATQYRQGGDRLRGSVWRLRYAKAFFQTETSLNAQLLWYPRRSQYRSLEEKINRAQMLAFDGDDDVTDRALETRLELTQNFSEDSSLSLAWRRLQTRRASPGLNSAALSLSATWREVDFSLYGSYDRYSKRPPEATLGINISIPFSLGGQSSNIAWRSDFVSRQHNTHGINLYGTALEDNSLRYDLTAAHTEHGDDSLNGSLGYQYNAGELNVSASRSGQRRQAHADVSGSVLLYDEGIAFGQTLGSTAALVQVPGAPGVAFYNQFGATTNASGDLMISYLTPWRVNRITVDSYSLPEGINMDVDELETVPTEGAIIRLRFPQP